MYRTIFLLMIVFVSFLQVRGQQKTYQIKADTVRIFNNCDTAELVLENRTKGILNGVLINKGKGVTEFRKILTKINACTYLVGGDSLKLDECNGNNSGSMAWLLNGNNIGAIKTLGTVDNFDLPFITNNAERVRITSIGNVGIGTTTPDARLHVKEPYIYSTALHVEGSSKFDGSITADTRDGFTGMLLQNLNYGASFRVNPPINRGFLESITIDQPSMSMLFQHGNSDHSGAGIMRPYTDGSEFKIFSNKTGANQEFPGYITFFTDDVERMRIATNNNVGIGTTTPDAKLHVKESNIFLNALHAEGNSRFDGSIVADAHNGFTVLQLQDLNYGASVRIPAPVNAGYLKTITIDQPSMSILFQNGNSDIGYAGIARPYTDASEFRIFSNKTGGNQENPGYITFFTDNVERMRIAANSNVGIGTTTPSQKLDVAGNIKTTGFILSTGSAAGKLLTSDADGNASWQSFPSNGFLFNAYNEFTASRLFATESIVYQSNSGGNQHYFLNKIGSSFTGNLVTIDPGEYYTLGENQLSLNVYGMQRNKGLSVNMLGNVGIGTIAPSAKLHALGTVRFEALNSGSGDPLVIDVNGNVTRGAGTPSDFYLKENISASNFNSSKLLGLTVKDFNYKSDLSKIRYTGLIAQELKAVIPELVLGKEGNYSIDYQKMVPYLLKTIQDQQKEIADLKQQMATGIVTGEVLETIQELKKQLLLQKKQIEVLVSGAKTK
ncbi:MAG: tail fiber domain-containing protein [Chitinophagaceae bacterium]